MPSSNSESSFCNNDQISQCCDDENNDNSSIGTTSTGNEEDQVMEINDKNDSCFGGFHYDNVFMLTQQQENDYEGDDDDDDEKEGGESIEAATTSAVSIANLGFITQQQEEEQRSESDHDDNSQRCSTSSNKSAMSFTHIGNCDNNGKDYGNDEKQQGNPGEEGDENHHQDKSVHVPNTTKNGSFNKADNDDTIGDLPDTLNAQKSNNNERTVQINQEDSKRLLFFDEKIGQEHKGSGFSENSSFSSNCTSTGTVDEQGNVSEIMVHFEESKVDHNEDSKDGYGRSSSLQSNILYCNNHQQLNDDMVGFTEDSQSIIQASDERDLKETEAIDLLNEKNKEMDIVENNSNHYVKQSQDLKCNHTDCIEECNDDDNESVTTAHHDNKMNRLEAEVEKEALDKNSKEENISENNDLKKNYSDTNEKHMQDSDQNHREYILNDEVKVFDEGGVNNATFKSEVDSSMTPLYVYNGITQSLPTQLHNSSIPQYHEYADTKKVSDTCQHSQSSRRKETIDHYQLDSNDESMYAASTEMINSENNLSQLMQHDDDENTHVSHDTLYDKSTVPLQTPTKSPVESKPAHTSPPNSGSGETMTIIGSYTENSHTLKTNLNDDLESPDKSQTKDIDLGDTMVQYRNAATSSPHSTAETSTLSQQNESEETITITGEDLITSTKTTQQNENSVSSKFESNKSLLGPTPTQTIDTLSYPNDYENKYSEIEKAKNETTAHKSNQSNVKERCENRSIDEAPIGTNNSMVSSHTMTTSQNLLESPQEKSATTDSAKITSKSTTKDDIIDSEGEEMKKEKSKHANRQHKSERRDSTSFSFLPPSPGKRQDKVSNDPIDEVEVRKRKLTFMQDTKENLDDDIVEDPSQVDVDLAKASSKDTPSMDNPVKKAEAYILTDTQPDEDADHEQQKTKKTEYKRIKRGIMTASLERDSRDETIVTSHNNIAEDENEWFDDDDEDSDESDVELQSQTTCDIKSMLQTLKEVNVDELKQNLVNHSVFSLKNAQEKIDALTTRNKKLRGMNKRHEEEKNQLKKKLKVANARLDEKTKLCQDMKAKLEELQPLIEVIQSLGLRKQDKSTPKRNRSLAKKKRFKQSSPVQKDKDKDEENSDASEQESSISDDDQKPRKLTFQTPKNAHSSKRKNDVGVVTISDRKTRMKKRAKGNITFQVSFNYNI